mgnify:CR=1 FL=1
MILTTADATGQGTPEQLREVLGPIDLLDSTGAPVSETPRADEEAAAARPASPADADTATNETSVEPASQTEQVNGTEEREQAQVEGDEVKGRADPGDRGDDMRPADREGQPIPDHGEIGHALLLSCWGNPSATEGFAEIGLSAVAVLILH